MANKQISQLTAKPVPVASTDQFGIDDNSSDSWKITVANLQTYFNTLYLALAGGTMTGNLTLAGNPTTNLMAATKQYVDSVATGLNIQGSCRVATTAALTVSYNNGSSGVGATITNAGAQAALAIDGVTLAVNDRVLVKNQASTLQNGIYTVTDVGSGASNWVMTRATDFDTATEIVPGDFVLVLSGTANAQTQWVQTATVVTVGTDPIVWDQFGADITAIITSIQNSSYVYSEDTGAADAYVATLAPAPTAYVEGMLVILDVANANTGASTINVNGLGLKNIVTEQNGALIAGDLIAARRAWLLYDGTSFRLVNRNIEKRNQNDSFNYILDTGAADAYAATLVPAVTAYVAGLRLSLKIANTNTTTSTVDVNGLGVKTIKTPQGGDVIAGDLLAGNIVDLRYDGTNFVLLNRNAEKRAQNESYQYILDTGSANTYVATLVPVVSALATGLRVSLKIATTNTGASTLNVNGLGATAIKYPNGAALVGNELFAGMLADLRYDGTNFQLLNPATVASSTGNPNMLINGGFRISQTGTSYTAATVPANNDDTYLLDQWVLLSDGNDILDVSQESTIIPTGSARSIKLDVETANKKAGIVQFLEAKNSRKIIGGVCSLSFKAQKVVGNATVDKLRAAVLSWSSTADSITSDVVSAWNAEGVDPTLVANWTYENTPSDLTLTDSWQTFRIENVSIDTASTANVAVFIWIDNTDGTVGDLVYITDVKLEDSKIATPYPMEIESEVLEECQRYWFQTYSQGVAPGTTGVGGNLVAISSGTAGTGAGKNAVAMPVQPHARMRVSPTATLYNYNTGTSGEMYDTAAAANVAATVGNIGDRGASCLNTGVTIDQDLHYWHVTMSSQL